MNLHATPEQLLAIYLNDHLAGATLGVELARRLRSSNASDAEMGKPLSRLCAEIEADRETLEAVMEKLGVRRSRIKPAVAWAGERLGRLKLNGRLHGYSPLSRLIELEGMQIGIAGKTQLWRALDRTIGSPVGDFDFAQLAERAARQREVVEELQLSAAVRSFPSAGTEERS